MSTPSEGLGLVLAHGIGGRQDLPVPFSYALTGAVAALVATFVLLGMLWREPRYDAEKAGVPVPALLQTVLDAPVFRWALRLSGLAVVGYVAVAAVFGPDLANNPTAAAVYVLFWVGVPFTSALFGPVWRQLNPLRTVHRLLAAVGGVPPERGIRPLPAGLGYWPAAAGLFAFTWLELVHPGRATVPVIRTWFLMYAGVQLLTATVYGSRWFDRGDAFEAYSSLIGRLAPLGRRADGRLVLRSPLAGLDGVQGAPGLVVMVCVLLGSTAYDGFSNSPVWVRFTQSSSVSTAVLGTLGLGAFVGMVTATYLLATLAAGRLGHAGRRGMPAGFAHSLVPIALGYVVAHYFSLFVFQGQHAVNLLSDPLVTGANLFGTAERGVNYAILTPATIAMVQVLAVVTGHVVGVVSAHDRAVALFSRRQAIAGQLPLLVVMVGYTLGGLTLLFAG